MLIFESEINHCVKGIKGLVATSVTVLLKHFKRDETLSRN